MNVLNVPRKGNGSQVQSAPSNFMCRQLQSPHCIICLYVCYIQILYNSIVSLFLYSRKQTGEWSNRRKTIVHLGFDSCLVSLYSCYKNERMLSSLSALQSFSTTLTPWLGLLRSIVSTLSILDVLRFLASTTFHFSSFALMGCHHTRRE